MFLEKVSSNVKFDKWMPLGRSLWYVNRINHLSKYLAIPNDVLWISGFNSMLSYMLPSWMLINNNYLTDFTSCLIFVDNENSFFLIFLTVTVLPLLQRNASFIIVQSVLFYQCVAIEYSISHLIHMTSCLRVSELLLFNANSTMFQLYHGDAKLMFNEMTMRFTLN
jgi:hypothetical protein